MDSASEEELSVLKSIFNEDFTLISSNESFPTFDLTVRFDTLPESISLIHEASNVSTEISHLPPIMLRITYKQTYPEQEAPVYCILCDYLTGDELVDLANQMDAVWRPGEVIVYTWLELLKEYMYNLSSKLILRSAASAIGDPRFVSNYDRIGSKRIYEQLIEYNRIETQLEFDQNSHSCPICLEERVGKDCLQFEKCHHYACMPCLNAYALEALNYSHEAKQVTCYDCQAPLFLSELRRMFSDDQLLLKYQQRLLEHTVDMVWCPRCHHSIICLPSESTSGNHLSFAECSQCLFTFCRRCQESWHPQVKCPKEELVQSLLKNHQQQKSTTGPAAQLEIDKLLLEISNIQTIERFSKPCPSCKARIEKNGGCQHMHCRLCQVHFCWECGWFGPAYAPHPCERKPEKNEAALPRNLSEQVERVLYDANGQPVRKDVAKRVQLCPKEDCRQANVKIGTQNSVVCEKCQTNFCFLCGETIYGKFHFSEYGCPTFTKIH